MSKPFNLLDAVNGAPVVTKDGRAVGQITHFRADKYEKYTVYGVVDGAIRSWNEQGVFNESGTSDGSLNIFMAPSIKERWVNIYEDDELGFYVSSILHKTKVDAMIDIVDDRYVTTVKVEWEE